MGAGKKRLLHLLQLAAHRLKGHTDRLGLEAAGVTGAQSAVLFVIARQPGITQRGIADALKQQESAITAMTSRLLRAQLVRRTQSPDDGRAWRLHLTQKGEASLRQLRFALDETNRMLDNALGEDGVEALARGLQAILELPLTRDRR